MKYKDIITLFVGIAFVLPLAYSIGVAKSVWFWIVPILLLRYHYTRDLEVVVVGPVQINLAAISPYFLCTYI